jgi:hypothetical protein
MYAISAALPKDEIARESPSESVGHESRWPIVIGSIRGLGNLLKRRLERKRTRLQLHLLTLFRHSLSTGLRASQGLGVRTRWFLCY